MSRYDYRDPSTDQDRCDALSVEPGEFTCLMCENIEQDDEFFPYCSASCARQADGESDEDWLQQIEDWGFAWESEDDENPRERHDDDGVEYGDPDSYRKGYEG